ncbi:CHAT domain-containing protein [Streptomyces sp. NBC_00554]|uniref:CHAT domain-containing tetratricopeptide repeat protein n=1 Tax=Streptomyces sp. NBC_00554 TaxID=2903661 RepID=UPI00352E0568|nr:CHAT domain-containing protein [Streptomyces sp. NBC_00554]
MADEPSFPGASNPNEARVREERLAVVLARLQRISGTGDLALAVDPQALAEAQSLRDLLREGDFEALNALGWLHWFRFQALPDDEDRATVGTLIEMFTPCFVAGVGELPEPLVPILADGTAVHATRVLQKALVSTDPALASDAAYLWQRILQATPARNRDWAWRLFFDLGLALRTRFEQAGDQEGLNQAINAFQTAVHGTRAGHPDQAWRLYNLSLVLQTRFERTGDQADLSRAIDALQTAVNATRADHPYQAWRLSDLGLALRTRFERTGDQADLNRAIDALQTAVDTVPADHPHQATMLSNLGGVLGTRFRRAGSQADLNRAIDALQTAVDTVPADHPHQATMLSNLGVVLRARFERTGDQRDLDRAIAIGRDAVNAAPADHPDRAGPLSSLGLALQVQFERTGDQEDLNQAIDALQTAVDTVPADHPDKETMFTNLGGALRARYERTGDQTDLNQAIYALQLAVDTVPADHPAKARNLTNLGNALRTRYERTRNQKDLNQAITTGQDAVNATPADHPDKVIMLSNLGGALRARYERTGDQTDLNQAIYTVQTAVNATPADHPDQARNLTNLGLLLQDRFERTGDQEDLNQAITTGQDAVNATPADHPGKAIVLSHLGGALRTRYRCTGNRTDLDQAVSALSRASEVVSAVPSVRIRAAWTVAQLVAGTDAGRAADAAEAAVRLLPEVTSRQLKRGDQQYALGQYTGLAGEAAALALTNPNGMGEGRATRALRLLEAGRAVLLSQALDTRSDLTDLNQQHPDLAARFVRLRDRLDQPADTFTPVDRSEDVDNLTRRQAGIVHERHQLAHDFAQTLAEIRALDGFASFALPPTAEELLAEAGPGPVVAFNVSRYRSDALLLTRDGITHCELPQLTVDAVTDTIAAFHRALETATSSEDKTRRRDAQATLSRVLEWLWDTAAGPVLDALGYYSQPSREADWPRVWWAPGGLLGLLPLHAAGYHTDPVDDPGRRTLADRVVSSYTPTVRALRYARRHPPAPSAPARALIVAMPTTPDLPNDGLLVHVRAEAAMLCSRLPNPVLLREPTPSDDEPSAASPSLPTRDNVLAHLPACPIAHFACHGASNPDDPSRSMLLLHDHVSQPLTVASLAPVRLDQVQLAYLSACRTAALDTAELIDEAIHLTSAFQLAGFPHVIGTLWEIDDRIAVTVADAFYSHLRTPAGTIDTSRAAWALHQAVRSVRDGDDLPGRLDRTRIPFLWAAYLHAGA